MFQNSFNYAFIGIPKQYTKTNENIYTQINKINLEVMLKENLENIPIVFYLNGSAGFTKGAIYREWITENTNYIFFSPNTLKIKNRPFYNPRSTIYEYEAVHNVRQKEIKFNLDNFLKFTWINKNRIILMGNSEGALAAGIYNGNEFNARILLAWNCEAGYYKSDVVIGADTNDKILTIIGTEDEYFSVNSEPNNGFKTTGNCIEKLKNYTQVKNVILSNTKHNLLNNPYVKEEILLFVNNLTP